MLTVISSTAMVRETEEVATTAMTMVMAMVMVRGTLTVAGHAPHARLKTRLVLFPANAAAGSDLTNLAQQVQTLTVITVVAVVGANVAAEEAGVTGEMVTEKVMIMTGGVLKSVSWIDFEQRRKRRGII